jgi:hypothetical protein
MALFLEVSIIETLPKPAAVAIPPTTVCLPFSLVPNMDAESSAYHKALFVFSKRSAALVGPCSPPIPISLKGIFIRLSLSFASDSFLF